MGQFLILRNKKFTSHVSHLRENTDKQVSKRGGAIREEKVEELGDSDGNAGDDHVSDSPSVEVIKYVLSRCRDQSS